MYTKLTLNITDTVVEKAKRAAKRRNTSVSRLVEDYLKKIPEEKEPGTEKNLIKAYLKKKYGN